MEDRLTRGTTLVLAPLLVLVVGASAGADPTSDGAGEDSAAAWMARMSEALLPGRSFVADVRIHTRDGYGGEQELALDLARHRGEDGSSRTLLRVEEPEAVAGTLFQVVTAADGRTRRHLWSPATDLVRTVKGVRGTEPFLGTEFTYEDLALLPSAGRAEGRVERVEREGRKLVAVRSGPYHIYARVVTLLDPETALPVRVEFHDAADQLFRVLEFDRVREEQGHPLAHRIRALDRITGSESVLTFSDVRVDGDLPEGFSGETVIDRRLEGAGEDARDAG